MPLKICSLSREIFQTTWTTKKKNKPVTESEIEQRERERIIPKKTRHDRHVACGSDLQARTLVNPVQKYTALHFNVLEFF